MDLPAAAEHLPSVAAAVAADPAALDALVEDAVVWASQHGLVRGCRIAAPRPARICAGVQCRVCRRSAAQGSINAAALL